MTDPASYHGTWATSSGPVVGVPGSVQAPTTAAPLIQHTNGNLTFSPATVVDPQRTEGEPLNFWDTAGNYWESGPWGTTTQNSFVHRSTDGGLEFHVDSPNGLRPDPGPGGDWPEPFGLTMVEAMATGTPVVAFRAGSVPEVVKHGETGFICKTLTDMVEAVRKVETLDRAKCRQHVETHFSPEAMTTGYERAYAKLLEQSSGIPHLDPRSNGARAAGN